MKITIVAGARPNFIKIAPIIQAIKQAQSRTIHYHLVHTGQHYDKMMSDTFFEELNIPLPDVNLNCASGTQAEQTASIMIAFEKYLIDNPCDLVLVVGDVTSTMACAIVAKKLCIKVAHVEAGIRSFDITMPEEINRMVTDSITDYFFTTSEFANTILKQQGVKESQIFYVGNVMIDTLFANLHRLKKPLFFDELKLKEKQYLLLTLHRPNNVDNPEQLKLFLEEIVYNVCDLPVIFPVHPRTIKTFENINLKTNNLYTTQPMGYLEFLYLVKNAKCVITDSGGITEETTCLGIPCMTLRDNTERPETCTIGTNELIGTNPVAIKPALDKLFNDNWKKGSIPYLWDGHTAERIINKLIELPW
jgi:UDP-N-acetylglucosamine 2-epimerase (non-hydrolysing)